MAKKTVEVDRSKNILDEILLEMMDQETKEIIECIQDLNQPSEVLRSLLLKRKIFNFDIKNDQ